MDTATAATTVAVVRDGEILAEQLDVDPRRHAEVLAPAIASVMARSGRQLAEVADVVVGVGPGAYTGLRVGLATATALAQALGVPVHGVVTLDALAYDSGLQLPFAVISDARRGEVFWATYADQTTRTSGPFVGRPDSVAGELGDIPVVGAAATPYGGNFQDPREPGLPSAGGLGRLAGLRLGRGTSLEPVVPVYLRQPDIAKRADPKSVLS